MISLLALALAGGQLPKPEPFLASINAALESRVPDKVKALFSHPEVNATYLLAMAQRRGGLAKLHAAMIPTPPGWEGRGAFWAVIHTFQDIEEDHDPVYEVMRTVDGFQLGREVREDDLSGWAVVSETYNAVLHPKDHSVDVDVSVSLGKGNVQRAPIFRLNDVYEFSPNTEKLVVATDTVIPKPVAGSLVRCGSLLIPWAASPALSYKFKYSAMLNRETEDKVDTKSACVTAWWLPSLGRLPYTVTGTITAPDNWTVRGEGLQVSRVDDKGEQTTSFKCDLPISYPKVIGGLYRLAAEQKVGDQDFKIFQLDPVESDRATIDLKAMVEAAAFYQSWLGPLPFPGYECYDSDTYYGIESYSHTLLQRRITHFLSHEMGHTYFGGLAPCPYVHDSWNEGLTEYVDSVLLLKDADGSLESALRTLDVDVPLTEMPEPHAYDGASYWRGCYVMKMLEAEIGLDKVKSALTLIAKQRRGMDTRWRDLRPYFEQTSGKSLQWFWEQWVENSKFPTLTVVQIDPIQREKTYRTYVKVRQTGTPKPLRLKFALSYLVDGVTTEQICDLDAASNDYTFDSEKMPTEVKLKVLGFTLARMKQYVVPKKG